MSHNADEDLIVPFTSPAPNSLQDPVYHMPVHSTNFKVILACHFPQRFLEAMYQVQWSCPYHSSVEVRKITRSSTEVINHSLFLPSPAFSHLVTAHIIRIARWVNIYPGAYRSGCHCTRWTPHAHSLLLPVLPGTRVTFCQPHNRKH